MFEVNRILCPAARIAKCIITGALLVGSLLPMPLYGQQLNANQPAVTQPSFNQPSFNQPASGQPNYQQPAPQQNWQVGQQYSGGTYTANAQASPTGVQRLSPTPFSGPPQLTLPAPPVATTIPTTNVPTTEGDGGANQAFPADLTSAESIPPGDEPTDAEGDVEENIAREIEAAKQTFFGAFTNSGQARQLAIKYLLPIVSFFVVMVASIWIGNKLKDKTANIVSERVDLTLGRFAGTLAKFVVIGGTLLAFLGTFGFEMTSLAAVIAAAGFAVGMALQGTLGNFAAGIALLVFRPFQVGDFIVVDGTAGKVQAIELFTTAIDTPDNRRIIVPNESVFGHRIENSTHNETRRVDVLVGVSYSADMKQTRRVLEDALASVPGALPNPAPVVYLSELNASSVDWSCRVWCRTPDYWDVKERLTESVKETLDRHGIGIPFPQLDLHVVTPTKQVRKAA